MKYRKQALNEIIYFCTDNKFYYYMCLSFALLGVMFGMIRMTSVSVAELIYGGFFGRVFVLLIVLYGTVLLALAIGGALTRLSYAGLFFGGYKTGVALYYLCAFGGFKGVLTALLLYLPVILTSFALLSTAAVLVLNTYYGGCSCSGKAFKSVSPYVAALFAVNVAVVALFGAIFSIFTPIIIIKL